MPKSRLTWALAVGFGLLLLAAGIGRLTLSGSTTHVSAFLAHRPHMGAFEARGEEHNKKGGEAGAGGPAEARYNDMAFPRKNIRFAQVKADHAAYARLASAHLGLDGRAPAKEGTAWEELGPVTNTVPASSTYTGRSTNVSGRVTAIAVAPTCLPGNCALYVGAAG